MVHISKSDDTNGIRTFEKLNPLQESLKISIIYMLAGSMWILLSDKILSLVVTDTRLMTSLSMIKGWAYVILTGLLIYSLVSSAFMKIKATEDKLYISLQNLKGANMELAAAYEQVAISRKELQLQYEKLLENQRKLIQSEKELEYQAYHDQITGVQNRLALINRINSLINEDSGRKIALIIADIDNFRNINDAMGHSFGDQLLIEVGTRLKILSEGCFELYRLSGDEYVILQEGFEEAAEVERLAVKLLKGFKSRFEINGSSLFATISMGAAVYPEHGDSLDELLKHADIALNKAKETGRNRIVFYTTHMNEAVAERVLIEKHLRTALDNNEFKLHYQPQIDIATRRISGLEALIRWESPELGSISPLKFINIAEDTHLIIPIGEWVLRNACMYLKELHQQGYDDLSVSVNISMLQLFQDDFADRVAEILDWSKLEPRYLELEITETILMESYEAIVEKLRLLRSKGVKIALDDFGKGYSSLNYLRQLPISTIKIDKSFIDSIGETGRRKSLTDLMVKIGRTMGMCVVAEGVETEYQLDYLTKHKCDKIQGYLFSKPVPAERVLDLLEKYNQA